jgi:hypothetical protein
VAPRLTAAARLGLALAATTIVLAGCGAAAGSAAATYPLGTPAPMASTTPAVAATRAELARVLGDQRLQLSDPQVPFRPAEGPALAGAPRAIYQVVLPEDPTKGYIAVYDLGDATHAQAAGADQAAYLASGPGKVQTPIGTRHVIRQLGPTIVLYSWHPDSAEDPRSPDIQTALETLGTAIPVPN